MGDTAVGDAIAPAFRKVCQPGQFHAELGADDLVSERGHFLAHVVEAAGRIDHHETIGLAGLRLLTEQTQNAVCTLG